LSPKVDIERREQTDEERIERAERLLEEMRRLLELHQQDLSKVAMASCLGLSRRTVYRRLTASGLISKRGVRGSGMDDLCE
jgi:transcriptional regulator of acetoin/glycerol metabolism